MSSINSYFETQKSLKPNSKEGGHLILQCNKGNLTTNVIFTTITIETQSLNLPIANVTIDTSCLHSPKTLIDFAGILTLASPNTSLDVTYNFTLYKTCIGDRSPMPVETFSYAQGASVSGSNFRDSRTLKFETCFCEDCSRGCCTYILELTSITNIIPNAPTLNISINGTLSVLAVDDNEALKACHKEGSHTILQCNKGMLNTSQNFPALTTETRRVNLPIASVTIDNSCHQSQKNLIDFAGILTTNATNPVLARIDATLTFILYRVCRGDKSPVPLENFTFSQGTNAEVDSRTLKFETCFCNGCSSDCCTYILELTSVTNNLLFDDTTTYTFSIDGTLSALVVDEPKEIASPCTKEGGHSILQCNKGAATTSLDFPANTTGTRNINKTIASVTIDTSCFKSSKTLVDFAGILTTLVSTTATPLSINALFEFTLYRTCRGDGVLVPIETFTLAQGTTTGTSGRDSRTLKFESCFCTHCSGECYTYVLELTNFTNFINQDQPLGYTVFINGALSAYVIDSCC